MPLEHAERSEKNLQRFLSLECGAALSVQPSYHLALPSDEALGFGDLLSGIVFCSHKTPRLQNLHRQRVGGLPCFDHGPSFAE